MHPILFHVGPFPVYAFGAMLGLSLLAGYQLALRQARLDQLPQDVAGNAFLIASIAGLLGARLAYAISAPDQYAEGGGLVDIQSGGLMGYGGIALGALAGAAYLAVKRQSIRVYGDAMAPAAALGFALGRVGSYLYGSEFGAPLAEGSTGLLARLGTYPRWPEGGLVGAPAVLHHIDVYQLSPDAAASLPTHPVQLYDVALGLALLGLCLLWRARRAYRGQVLAYFTLAFAVGRFLTGYLRDDPDRGVAFGFTHTQLFCLLLLAIGVLGVSALRPGGGAAPAPEQGDA